ncbi:hypothetical protein [Motilimonas sp. E26]|uniref:hypothetical protein n=1 Tax=Motilimonas sp. E26 TaxID=2865674 RepID=UPI001E4D21EA|nr:hypothetical protein [Motilimonas sp. E26]MCE0555593.1 hypothetical protein [Motilimonas sp. E26]
MSNVVSLHEFFYNLLIVKRVNNFTITELRDALLDSTSNAFSPKEARLYVYRRVLFLESKELLVKTKSSHSKEVRYITSAQFENVLFKSKKTLKQVPEKKSLEPESFFTSLQKEKKAHEDHLLMIEGELETFASLIKRYPDQKNSVKPFFNQAEQEHRRLYSHVRAISKILKQQ